MKVSIAGLLSCLVASVLAVEQQQNPFAESVKHVNHGKALMEWLRTTEGGFFHPHLELRQQGDSPFYGMYAKNGISENDMLIRIPREMLITPEEQFRVGDRVEMYFEEDEETYLGVIGAVHDKEDTVQLIYDDGERNDAVPADEVNPHNINCKTVETLVRELKLGNESQYAPYVNYLNSQPYGQLPSAWSEAGKDLFREITGKFTHDRDILPPFDDPLGHINDYEIDCNKKDDPFGANAYLLLQQRGWDDILIPVFDMMSHGNGHWLNTKVSSSVHDENSPVIVQAARQIEAGEEIFTSYNFCEDCGSRKLLYGTPELLRDYGFVEHFPQRWVFEDQDTIFDLERNFTVDGEDTGKLELSWVEGYELKPEQAPFFVEQLQRLKDLGETVFATKDPEVPDHEWQTLLAYRGAMMKAMEVALEVSGHESCKEGSCEVSTTRYKTLDQELEDYWDDARPKTCHDRATFGVAFWEETEVVESPYQTIVWLENPTYDPIDTCLMLDNIWQICTVYRPHYHEMAVHYTAGYLDEVKRVLFVGGGDSMLLHDVLKYPTLEKVIGLEIDQQVTRGSFKHFGVQPHFDDERVEWWFGDAAKSMLMLPREYYGTFDLVLVDLSETVVSMSVTAELDVMEALSLLIKKDGILVKNEYNYFPKQRNTFRDALHIHYYNNPVVCSQSFILCSNGIDFLRSSYKKHEVDHIYHLIDEPNLRYQFDRDYQKNHTNPHDYCIASEKYVEEPTVQEQSPGITMIVEAEQGSSMPQSSGAIKETVEAALKEEGFSVVESVVSQASKQPAAVTIFREGYIVARAWPEDKHTSYDIHLWSSFEKHEDAKKSLVEAVGSTVNGPSSSSYRVVSGGMFGVSTWKEDEKKRGPKLDECSDETDESKVVSLPNELDGNAILSIVGESMSLIQDESKFVVAVICGPEGTACPAVDTMKKAGPVGDVIPLHQCAELVEGAEFMEDAAVRMLTCEKNLWKLLDSNVSDKKKIRAIVVDKSAESTFSSILQSMCRSKVDRKRFFAENMAVVAPLFEQGKTWRKTFVDYFRREIFPEEPSFKSGIFFNNTARSASSEVAISSSGDILFFEHLVQFVENVEKKIGVVGEINNVRGGDFIFQDPFEAIQNFTDAHFDQASQMEQWESQKPLGLQTIFQLQPANQKSVSYTQIYMALKMVLAKVLEGDTEIKEFTDVGDGCVLVSFWDQGHVVVLWDGKDHVDVNLFTYSEDFDFVDTFEKSFAEEALMKRTLRDMQPRGTGRVVSFARDLKDGAKPRWSPSS